MSWKIRIKITFGFKRRYQKKKYYDDLKKALEELKKDKKR
jgi:hypothetical protein